MSVAFPIPRQVRRQDLVATGGQTAFNATDFQVFDVLDVRVSKKLAGAPRFIPLTTGYTVALAGAAPNYPHVTLGAGLAAGDAVRIEGARTAERVTDVSQGGTIRGVALEHELDATVIVEQELRRDIDDLHGIYDYVDTKNAAQDIIIAGHEERLDDDESNIHDLQVASAIHDTAIGSNTLRLNADEARIAAFEGVILTAGPAAGPAVNVLDSFIPQPLHAAIKAGTSTADLATYLANAQAFIAALMRKPTLVFPSGLYCYSASPNWAVQNATYVFEGDVRLRCTSTTGGHGFNCDASAITGGLYNIRVVGRPTVEVGNSGGHGIYTAMCHESHFDMRARGAGVGKAGWYIYGGVCSYFRPVVSGNLDGWFSSVPGVGLTIDGTLCGSRIDLPRIEGVAVGLVLVDGWNNHILGGTVEGCTSYAVDLQAGAWGNVIERTWLEANAGFDIRDNGMDNKQKDLPVIDFLGNGYCLIGAGARRAKLEGGRYKFISIFAGATDTQLQGVTYNRQDATTTDIPISDAGTRTNIIGCLNEKTGLRHNAIPFRAVQTVGASPWTYSNTKANAVAVNVIGGTVSTIVFAGSNSVGDPTGSTGGVFVVPPGGSLGVTYSVAPTVIAYSL